MNQAEPTQKYILDGLLEEWHRWASKTELTSMPGKCAMFSQCASPRHWDSTGDIDDSVINQSTMDAMDFAILGDNRGQGGLMEPYRAAVTTYARNLTVKVSVFTNPRLPSDPLERAALTGYGLDMLARQLKIAGVL